LRASEPAAEILSERSESKDLLQKSVAAEPISRILSAARSGRAIIPLGRALLRGSSDLPGSCGAPSRHAVPAGTSSPIWSCSVWGLPCHRHYWRRGALLPHLFTLTPPNSAQRFIPVGAPGSPFFWANLGCDPPVALTCLLLAIVGSLFPVGAPPLSPSFGDRVGAHPSDLWKQLGGAVYFLWHFP